ncbi:MAG: glucosamine-6-phosphate deaminase [bacterium]|nr:glucosamine-6-phosphate deaminase [bacterium]
MEIIIKNDYDEMSLASADIVIKQIREKPHSSFSFIAGYTPIGLYRELVTACQHEELSFAAAKAFDLDEYVGLSPEDENSFYHFLNKHIFINCNFDQENVYLINGGAQDLEDECLKHEQLIMTTGGIDVQFLGIGQNGHIGFNEPGSSFDSVTRVIDLASKTRYANAKYFGSIEAVPYKAITVGLKTIMQARQIVLMATGEKKADIVAAALQGEITEEVPASILQRHDNLIVVLDKEAAAKLKNI